MLNIHRIYLAMYPFFGFAIASIDKMMSHAIFDTCIGKLYIEISTKAPLYNMLYHWTVKKETKMF